MIRNNLYVWCSRLSHRATVELAEQLALHANAQVVGARLIIISGLIQLESFNPILDILQRYDVDLD